MLVLLYTCTCTCNTNSGVVACICNYVRTHTHTHMFCYLTLSVSSVVIANSVFVSFQLLVYICHGITLFLLSMFVCSGILYVYNQTRTIWNHTSLACKHICIGMSHDVTHILVILCIHTHVHFIG